MKKAILLILTLLILSCTIKDELTTERVEEPASVQDKQSVLIKPFANPVNIFGSNFIAFLAELRMTEPGNRDTLLFYVSEITKKQYSKKDILLWFEKNNLNFKKKLVAVNRTKDSLYILSFRSDIVATSTLRTFTVAVENDTCRLVVVLDKFNYP